MFTYVFIEKDVSDRKGRIGENAQPGKIRQRSSGKITARKQWQKLFYHNTIRIEAGYFTRFKT